MGWAVDGYTSATQLTHPQRHIMHVGVIGPILLSHSRVYKYNCPSTIIGEEAIHARFMHRATVKKGGTVRDCCLLNSLTIKISEFASQHIN